MGPAEEVHVLDDIAAFVNAGEGRSEMEIHVSEEAMLRVAGAHGHCARIAFAYFDVNICEGGIKGPGIGVGNRRPRINRIARTASTKPRTAAGEKDHHLL